MMKSSCLRDLFIGLPTERIDFPHHAWLGPVGCLDEAGIKAQLDR